MGCIAERMARFSTPASRAFTDRLASLPGGMGRDPKLLKVFSVAGQPLGESDLISQVDLGSVIGAIRARGAGEFYQGSTGRRFVNAANAVGGRLTEEDLRRYRVQWEEPVLFEIPTSITNVGGQSLMLPPLDNLAAKRAAWMWQLLRAQSSGRASAPVARATKIVRASARAMTQMETPLTLSAGRVLGARGSATQSDASRCKWWCNGIRHRRY